MTGCRKSAETLVTLDHAGKEETLPWKETSPVTERKKFIDDYLTGEFTVTDQLTAYGEFSTDGSGASLVMTVVVAALLTL